MKINCLFLKGGPWGKEVQNSHEVQREHWGSVWNNAWRRITEHQRRVEQPQAFHCFLWQGEKAVNNGIVPHPVEMVLPGRRRTVGSLWQGWLCLLHCWAIQWVGRQLRLFPPRLNKFEYCISDNFSVYTISAMLASLSESLKVIQCKFDTSFRWKKIKSYTPWGFENLASVFSDSCDWYEIATQVCHSQFYDLEFDKKWWNLRIKYSPKIRNLH